VKTNDSFSRRRFKWLTLAALTCSAVMPTVAQAAPPNLLSVGRNGGQITANWAIPPGMAMDYIEAGSSAAVTPEGDFPLSNTVMAESLGDFQTSYASTVQIPQGTYFVHVSAFDTKKCKTGDEPNCVDEWSNMLTVTVPPGADKSTNFSFLDASSPQRIGKLAITAQMGEPGTITAAATVRVPNASKVYKFKTASASAIPGIKVKLRLRLPKKALKVVRKALKKHKKISAKVTATARDKSGNAHSEKGTIRLKL
jgi:hypothetical protein